MIVTREKAELLANIEIYMGQLRYVRCPYCHERLHRYYREADYTHRDYCHCVECGAHIGWAHEEHQRIEQELRRNGVGEALIEYLRLEPGPVTLDDPALTRNLGGYGEAVE